MVDQIQIIRLEDPTKGRIISKNISGPQGNTGQTGLGITNGTTDPTDDIGRDGEFYINTIAEYIAGPKTNGTWTGTTRIYFGGDASAVSDALKGGTAGQFLRKIDSLDYSFVWDTFDSDLIEEILGYTPSSFTKAEADTFYAEIIHTHNVSDIIGLGSLATKNTIGNVDIDASSIEFGKIQNVNPNKILGRVNTIGSIEEISIGSNLLLSGTTLSVTGLATVALTGAYADLTGKPTLATVATSGSYNDLSDKPTIPSSTSQISEGTNLYFTDERVDDRVAALIQNGTGITWSYNDVAGTLTPTVTVSQYTDEQAQDATASLIQNGTGISWSYNDVANTLTPTVSLASFSTTNLAEGTNQYFTTTRARSSISATGSLSYNSTTGVMSFTETYSNATALLNAIKTVDGAGSGLDADLLDGLSSNAFFILGTNTSDNITVGTTNLFLTSAERTKLSSIAAGAEVNQNAFTTIAVSGQSNVVADTKTDTLTFASGSNITLTTNASTDTVTIAVSGLATVATTGAYNDLTGKPTLSTVATTGDYNDLINIPSFATVATTGSYNDLSDKPTIPTSLAELTGTSDNIEEGIFNLFLTEAERQSIQDSADSIGSLATVAYTGDYGDLSGIPTIPSAIFSTIAVSGQSSVVADSATDTLTLANGTGISITTNAGTDTITIASTITQYTDALARAATVAQTITNGVTTSAPSQDAVYDALILKANISSLATVATSGSYNDLSDKPTFVATGFTNIAVSGQSTVVSDTTTDTLTLVAGTNVTITTNAATDTITINATGGGGASDLADLGDVSLSSPTNGQVLTYASGVWVNADPTGGGGGGGTLGYNLFTGDGVEDTFTCSAAPLSEDETIVFIDGVHQGKTSYSFVGADIIFTEAPTNGASIEVNVLEDVGGGGGGSYTDEEAQDAVGSILDATLTYNDATPSIGINLNNANTWTADQSVPDEAYSASGWNGSVEVPTKNAVRDKLESMFTGVANITVGTTAPVSPSVGDLWVDTN